MNITEATEWLVRNDSVIASIYKISGPCSLEPGSEPFPHLLNAIVSQQISTKAATSVFAKLSAVLEEQIRPEQVLKTDWQVLRSAGLSGQKVGYVINLAEHFIMKPEFYANLPNHSDEEIIEELVTIKGIGKWSAQMFLIFNLNRPNILPTDDLGLKKGMQMAYQLDELPTKKVMEKIAADNWGNFATIGTWYMWRATEIK